LETTLVEAQSREQREVYFGVKSANIVSEILKLSNILEEQSRVERLAQQTKHDCQQQYIEYIKTKGSVLSPIRPIIDKKARKVLNSIPRQSSNVLSNGLILKKWGS
jgi:hypothetical protein